MMLATVLLRHEREGTVHHDWMLEPPLAPVHQVAAAQPRLWTARVGSSSDQWPTLRHFELEVIGRHRRDFLTYQGSLGGVRGEVCRVDEGGFVPFLWTASRIVIGLSLTRCGGLVEMVQFGENRWQVVFKSKNCLPWRPAMAVRQRP